MIRAIQIALDAVVEFAKRISVRMLILELKVRRICFYNQIIIPHVYYRHVEGTLCKLIALKIVFVFVKLTIRLVEVTYKKVCFLFFLEIVSSNTMEC